MDMHFTIKFSPNRKAWACFPASNEVLMISPLLSDTWKLFMVNKAVRTPNPSHLQGLCLAGLKANTKHSWWPWRQPLWRRREETSAGTAPHSLGSCFYGEPLILHPCLSCAATTLPVPGHDSCWAGSQPDPALALLVPTATAHDQESWLDVLTIPRLAWPAQVAAVGRGCSCWEHCPQSWGCDSGVSPNPRTTRLDPKHPQTLHPSPPPAQLLSLNNHTYPGPGCKWHPAPLRFSSGLWWHQAGAVGRAPTPTSPGYY